MSRLRDLELNYKFDPTRQRDIFDPLLHEHENITLVGCGGIGSPTALALSKLGIARMVLIDDDIVESHNVPNQFYTMDNTGTRKVEALREHCESFGASEVVDIAGKVQDHAFELFGIVITGLDSMEARQDTWEIVKQNPRVKLLIDARIGKEEIAVWAIDPMDSEQISYYEENALYDDNDAIELGCTERAIIDVSFQVASQVTRVVRKYLNEEPISKLVAFHQGTLQAYEEE